MRAIAYSESKYCFRKHASIMRVCRATFVYMCACTHKMLNYNIKYTFSDHG